MTKRRQAVDVAALRRKGRELARARRRDGLKFRDDGSSFGDSLVAEVLRLTKAKQVPTRRAVVEASDLAARVKGRFYLASTGNGEFRNVNPWMLDGYWKELIETEG